MVIVQHPSEPNPKEPRRYSRATEIGKGRSKVTGHISYSDRIGPGVLVLHEWFGFTPSFVRFCDRLCEEGFTALGIDLYDGKVASTPEEAEALKDSIDWEQARRRVRAAAEHLRDNWHPRLGTVGFSLGAMSACEIAATFDVEATVLYYGAPEGEPEKWTSPVLGHYAQTDEWEPLEYVRERVEALEAAGADIETHVYEGVGHWFANADVPDAYDAEAAELALGRTVDFLHHHLA